MFCRKINEKKMLTLEEFKSLLGRQSEEIFCDREKKSLMEIFFVFSYETTNVLFNDRLLFSYFFRKNKQLLERQLRGQCSTVERG